MRDLYIFDKRLSDRVDILPEYQMKANSRAIGVDIPASWYQYMRVLYAKDSWFSRRGIKLKRKVEL